MQHSIETSAHGENTPVDRPSLSTIAIHAGERRGLYRDLMAPVSSTSTWTFPDSQAVIDHAKKVSPVDEYARYGNLNERIVAEKLAALEGAEECLMFDSGMGALSALLLGTLRAGDEVVISDESYHRIRSFCSEHLTRFGIASIEVPTGDYEALEAAITPRTKLLISESPTNPHLTVIDLQQFVAVARRHGIETLIDATLATPYNVQPIRAGVDYVLHSATKYLGGHNNLMAGSLAGTREKLTRIRTWRDFTGGVCTPDAASKLNTGLMTFPMRMQQHNCNGQLVAQFLERDPRVERVYYPGLDSHPTHAVARQTMSGFGGLVTFLVKEADCAATQRVVDACQLAEIAASLGGVHTMIQQPRILNHYHKTPEECARINIPDNMIRLSCGLENVSDIIADLDRALGAQ